MAGYTPVFDTVFNGTLCGKWPELPVWLTLLPLADWRGYIEMTPEAIAARTGWPLDLLLKGIEILCQPDPRSRSKDEEGRRLVLIDPARDWGWRVVNIGVYRTKASGQDQIDDGRNADKVRRYKERHRKTPEDTARHRKTLRDTDDTHSDSNTDSNTDSNKEKKTSLRSVRAPARARSRRCPKDFAVTDEMRKWAKETCPNVDLDRETACFLDHEFRDPHSDWLAVWRQWMRRSPEFRRNGGSGVSREDTGWRPTE